MSALDGAYTPGELTVHHAPDVVRSVTRALRSAGRRVALVPTMGALHAGHVQLVEMAKRSGAVVVVSIFVNPLQFGAGEDLDAYPRTLDADLDVLRAAGVELAFVPSVQDMYPHGPRTTAHPGPLGAELEGASRPGHFAGMLTVVAKLLGIVAPTTAYFGEKDYQQLVLIDQMVRDLNIDVEIRGVPIVRESDGLALSSRNRYLDEHQRSLAVALSAALIAGTHAAEGGSDAVLAAAQSVLDTVPEVDVDYLEVRGADLRDAPEEGDGRLLVAARVGTTRLLDNVGVALGTGFQGRDPESAAGQRHLGHS
ncbi:MULTISPECIES: pantoate--beta-alanine ligase [unclassified Rhodococcus (in: high G+C Gram-positive bacteria)]|uniref:pantoate--beta-alanine ligase n=1 Tax=unclassified Rhodococcus (in: high G+C Gram-positive bacteria) TaxID=192944 RepID=UPI0006F57E3C|nr:MULTISPECIES: pantoate--beta-alanine ligase [unclassified Rhodococcus (in: high G+C Gram-positive bacteria)]KQU28178.1 pantoate--beta-alanine ligase [Rhodococcus sp. Leaf225]KQU46288.1 pantoate--beta-alanine ligase [Rhodococcus sp. Leaf258]